MINDAAASCLTLVELSKLAMFSFDVELNQFTYINPAFREYAILKENSLSKIRIKQLIHPEDAGLVKEAYQELLQEDEKKKNVEFRIVLADKSVRTIRVEAFITSIGDRLQVVTGIIEDITSFKDHNDILNKFSNKKNALLTILSHDLLGPLGTIRNLSTIIKRKTEDSDTKELTQLVNSIEKISNNSIKMIQSLMNQEFLESADAELVFRRINIVKAIRTLIEEYKQSEEISKRIFNLSASSDIILIDIDEAKVLQVINNLVTNALKFTQEDGIIEVSIKEEDNSILLTVSDNGIGIPTRYHDSLFDKFTSARRTGLHGETTHGLGMSIIKSIIEWHHGQLWFESQENEGTTFYIRLPGLNRNS
jgi:two-component system sensor histidine kinase VicK